MSAFVAGRGSRMVVGEEHLSRVWREDRIAPGTEREGEGGASGVSVGGEGEGVEEQGTPRERGGKGGGWRKESARVFVQQTPGPLAAMRIAHQEVPECV